jgi:pSer/pThr/pTyr-binding forkhead associated (FHA) protein/ABC-type lipoprotein export system ATPase subunit
VSRTRTKPTMARSYCAWSRSNASRSPALARLTSSGTSSLTPAIVPVRRTGFNIDALMFATVPVHPVLEIRSEQQPPRQIVLIDRKYTVGRHPENDIVVDSPGISRFHLRLELRLDGGYTVEDSSTNGTWINGQRITRAELSDLTELRLGGPGVHQTKLVYHPVADFHTRAAEIPPTSLIGRNTLVIGRDPGCDLVLSDPVCSRRHALLERTEDGGWSIRDLDTTNGTFVDGTLARQAELTEGATILIGNTTLVFNSTSLTSPPLARSGRGIQVDVAIDDGISVSVRPGELVAFVGARRPFTQQFARGQVLLNGISLPAHRGAFRSAIAYVARDDVLHRQLTVWRTLRYAAQLRMPRDADRTERDRRARAVLDGVGLTPFSNVPVHRLSPGQRKRVNIAVELLARPPLVVLDEPTHGLNPSDARELMQLMREIAASGHTVILATGDGTTAEMCDRTVLLPHDLATAGRPTTEKASAAPPRPALRDTWTLLLRELEVAVRDWPWLALLGIQAIALGWLLTRLAEFQPIELLTLCAATWFALVSAALVVARQARLFRRESAVGVGRIPHVASTSAVGGLLTMAQLSVTFAVLLSSTR